MLAWEFYIWQCYVSRWLNLDKAEILTTQGYQSSSGTFFAGAGLLVMMPWQSSRSDSLSPKLLIAQAISFMQLILVL